MHKFRETPQYIQVTGAILAALLTCVVLDPRGIRGLITFVVLALVFILALNALRRKIGRK
jgi:hypothetical protein